MRPRFASGAPVVLTVSVGIGVGIAAGVLHAALREPMGCVDLLFCGDAAAPELVSRPTPEALEIGELLIARFRSMSRVGLTLSGVLIALIALNLFTSLLARTAARRREIAIRAAVGATPLRLVRGLLATPSVFAVASVAAGLAIGIAGVHLLAASWPLGDAPWRSGPETMLLRVFISAFLLLVLGCASVWPAGVAWSSNLRRHLGAGGRATPGPAEALLQDGLTMLQTAVSLVLLASAALLLQPFVMAGMERATDGVEPDLALVTQVRLADFPSAVPDEAAVQYGAMLERVRRTPGVVDSSLASEGAWVGLGFTDRVTALCVECRIGLLPKQQTSAPTRIHAVSGDFFRATAMQLERGRSIRDADSAGAARVAVISRAFALRFFPNGEPLGKEVRLGGRNGEWYEVVGVVEDLRARGLASGAVPEPAVYLSILQRPTRRASLIVVGSGDPESLGVAIRQAAKGGEAGLLIGAATTTLDALRQRYRAPLAWFGMVYGALAAAVLLFSAAGIFGLVTYRVHRRTREIGIRMALGAEAEGIVRLILGRTVRLVALGILVGLIPLSGLARYLQVEFAGVDPFDFRIAAGTVALLTIAALAASARPARRASRLEPRVALSEG